MPRNAIIMGAAGRDFHNFNVFFRDNPDYTVVAFTASSQIPFVQNRLYPHDLAGGRYPKGIPIYDESLLPKLVKDRAVQDVFFSYSDISHEHVMHLASLVLAQGASFHFLGPNDTSLSSGKPVIAVVATRTGAGKSTVARKVVDVVRKHGLRPVVVRHPMPYGDFAHPVQVFRTPADLDRYNCTLEEREEFEGHLAKGVTVYAGVDYERILWEAEKEGDLIIWDGGNNDLPFYKPSTTIVVVDPLRPSHETKYHPGEANLRMANIVVVNKSNVAEPKDVEATMQSVRKLNPEAKVVRVRSDAIVDQPNLIRGKRVLVIEDGPSVTHGELREGAGAAAARSLGATLVDPRGKAVGSILEAFRMYPKIGPVLPALGYSRDQLTELEETIQAVDCDAVVLGTPADLGRLIRIARPVVKVRFEAFDEYEEGLEYYLNDFLKGL